MDNKVYNFLADAGHGWLEVSLQELKDLNLIHKISNYSYINGPNAYLEEDCDLGTFVEALGHVPDIKEMNVGDYWNGRTTYASFQETVQWSQP